MLIPIRCVTCNTILAGKWDAYVKARASFIKEDGRTANIPYLTTSTTKTAEGRAMDSVKLFRECCRRHMLTCVELM